MLFRDTEHEEAFYEFLSQAKVNIFDNERKALFYLFALTHDLRTHIHELYDFKRNMIKTEGLSAPFQTSSSTAITQLAFTLYNGYEEKVCEEVNECDLYILQKKYNADYEDYDLDYTDMVDLDLRFNHPMYIPKRQPFNLMNLFALADRALLIYLYQAINIRLNVQDILSH